MGTQTTTIYQWKVEHSLGPFQALKVQFGPFVFFFFFFFHLSTVQVYEFHFLDNPHPCPFAYRISALVSTL